MRHYNIMCAPILLTHSMFKEYTFLSLGLRHVRIFTRQTNGSIFWHKRNSRRLIIAPRWKTDSTVIYNMAVQNDIYLTAQREHLKCNHISWGSTRLQKMACLYWPVLGVKMYIKIKLNLFICLMLSIQIKKVYLGVYKRYSYQHLQNEILALQVFISTYRHNCKHSIKKSHLSRL